MTILNKEKILEQAKAFIDEGKLDKAIREYEKILLADSADMRVKLRIAELYTKRKQINEAIRIYREVAGSYTSDGFLLKAVTVYKNMLRLNPSLMEVNEELAGLYDKMGLTADAIRQYDILASALGMKGMHERVIEVRQKIVALNPEDGKARVRLAETFQREGRTEEAIDQYEDYAQRLERQGAGMQKLADVFEKILAHRPNNFDLIRKLIGLYEETGDHKKALRWLEEGKEMTEREPEFLKLMAAIYTTQNQNETARGKLMILADLQNELGNPEAALEAYFEILVIMPDDEDRLFERVEAIKPGCMAELAARAEARRKELETEEIRRQEEEETDKAHVEEEQAKVEVKVKVKVKQQPQAKPKSKPKSKPKPQPSPKARPDRGKADAAYNLGGAYMKMGLAGEAEAEFKKALAIYKQCADAGVADEAVKKRIAELDSSQPKPQPKPKLKLKPKPKPQPKPSAKPDGKVAKPQKDKKRISYV